MVARLQAEAGLAVGLTVARVSKNAPGMQAYSSMFARIDGNAARGGRRESAAAAPENWQRAGSVIGLNLYIVMI